MIVAARTELRIESYRSVTIFPYHIAWCALKSAPMRQSGRGLCVARKELVSHIVGAYAFMNSNCLLLVTQVIDKKQSLYAALIRGARPRSFLT